MIKFKSTIAIALLVISPTLMADHKHKKHRNHNGHSVQIQHYDYARVIRVKPVYRQIKVSNPVTECWDKPVQHNRHKSAGGIVAGGLIGGIVGNQIGKGRGRKLATVVGAIVGAQIGHEAVNGHSSSSHGQYTSYQEHCEVHEQVSYDEVIDGYKVTYEYQGERYKIEMPYHPGKRIKMHIQVSPVI